MSFTFDTKSTTTLNGDTKSSAGIFTNDTHSTQGITWGSDFLTWTQETRTWGQVVSQLTLDTKN